MFKLAIVMFREFLEISLLLGIILATTKPIKHSRRYIIIGTLLGLMLSSVFAFFIRTITKILHGMGDELFDSAIILLTVVVISSTVVWMQGYSKNIKHGVEHLSNRILAGSAETIMLVLVVTTTIFREGVEIMLFVYSIATAENLKITDYLLGLGFGAFAGFVTGMLVYRGLQLTGRYIFKISSILLVLVAAGLSAKAAGILTSSGMIEALSETLWDSSWLIDSRSLVGEFLHIIAGYDPRPNGMQVVFYVATITLNIVMARLYKIIYKPHPVHKQTMN